MPFKIPKDLLISPKNLIKTASVVKHVINTANGAINELKFKLQNKPEMPNNIDLFFWLFVFCVVLLFLSIVLLVILCCCCLRNRRRNFIVTVNDDSFSTSSSIQTNSNANNQNNVNLNIENKHKSCRLQLNSFKPSQTASSSQYATATTAQTITSTVA